MALLVLAVLCLNTPLRADEQVPCNGSFSFTVLSAESKPIPHPAQADTAPTMTLFINRQITRAACCAAELLVAGSVWAQSPFSLAASDSTYGTHHEANRHYWRAFRFN